MLRQLSVLYLVAATSFGVAIVLSQHPALNSAAKSSARFVGHETAVAAVALNDHVIQPGWAWTKVQTGALAHRVEVALNPSKAPVAPPGRRTVVARQEPVKPMPPTPAPKPKIAAVTPPLRPEIVEAPKPAPQKAPEAVAETAPPKITLAPPAPRETVPPSVAALPPPPAVSAPAPSPAELVRVTQRLKDSLTDEMLQHFDLFLYVSKADHGPLAQRMYVFQKTAAGGLALMYNWPVSTGREKVEFAPTGQKEPSFTPAGYYELDPGRMYPHYTSMQWHQPMPYAMFFNWEDHGYQTGLAIHAASGEDVSLLGTRSSAGCVRLAPENARVLFSMVRQSYKGLVPKFAYDKRTATMSNNGMLLHDRGGNLELEPGYKVLVFIEDYGGEQVVAALF
ncbi:MAG: L,D-transpeptidase [Rhizomicrobium sp.]